MKTGQEHNNEQCTMNNVQWKKVKLGEVVVPLKGKLTEQSDCFHDDWKSLINTTAIDGESKTWANPINAVLCEPDDVLMLWDGERSGLVITGKQGVVGSTFARLRPNHELDGKYLYFFLLNNFEWIQNRRTGTGVPHAPKDLMRIFQISYPESLPAQRRIAAILASADKVIAATQKTIAKYKQIKQGMMEDLLKPKEGWKMVKLGEVGEIVTGSTPTTTKAEYWDGEYNFYSPADFDDRVYCGKTERTVTKAGMDTGRRIPKNSIMVACIASIGKLSINQTEGITNQQINTIVPKAGYDYIFLYYLLLLNVEKIKGGAAQTTIPIINKEDFSNLEFSVPDFSEQKRMASILNGIDSKIEVEQRVLNKYIQVKKGLMEKLLNEKL